MNYNRILNTLLTRQYSAHEADIAEKSAILAARISARMAGAPRPPAGFEWRDYYVLATNASCITGRVRLEIVAPHEATDCDRCGQTHLNHLVESVRTRTRISSVTLTESYCPACVEESAFRCERNGRLYHADCYTQVTLGDTGESVCQEAHEADLYWDENREEWLSEPIEEEEEGPDEYHASKNREIRAEWRRIPQPGSFWLGVELETLAPQGGVADWAETCRNAGMLAERDGSLDCVRGVEVIGAPVPLAECASHWVPLLNAGRAQGVRAYGVQGSYGLHVNLNRSGFSGPLHVAKTALFVHAHQRFSERIAGRLETSYARFDSRLPWIALANRFGTAGEKYRCVNVQTERVEFRLFQANLRPAGFLRCVEYAHAVASFCRQPVSLRDLRRGVLSDDFRAFVRMDKGRYPHLFAFLFPPSPRSTRATV